MEEIKFVQETISVNDLEIPFYSVQNFDLLFDRFIEKGNEDIAVTDERIPYWAKLWPSAVGLALHLNKLNLLNKNILEIGAGLALPSLLCAKKEANVIVTDYLEEALEVAKKNFILNNLNASFLNLDWRNFPENLNPQLIIASDIAYERRMYGSILELFKMLNNKNIPIVFSEPNRMMTDDFIKEIYKSFDVSADSYMVEYSGIKTKINVYTII